MGFWEKVAPGFTYMMVGYCLFWVKLTWFSVNNIRDYMYVFFQ